MNIYSAIIVQFLLRKLFTCQVITQSYLFNAFEFIFILNHVFSKEPQWFFFSDDLLARLFSANELHYVVFLSFFYIQQFPKFFMVQVFHSPGFSEPIDFSDSRSFRVQVFLSPCFSGSGSTVLVWVQILEVAKSLY